MTLSAGRAALDALCDDPPCAALAARRSCGAPACYFQVCYITLAIIFYAGRALGV